MKSLGSNILGLIILGLAFAGPFACGGGTEPAAVSAEGGEAGAPAGAGGSDSTSGEGGGAGQPEGGIGGEGGRAEGGIGGEGGEPVAGMGGEGGSPPVAGMGGEGGSPPDNPCEPDPCQNGGQCDPDGDGYVCTCPAGFSGDNCETNVDDCAPNPCLNGGVCSDGIDDYTCTCPAGFSGDNCQTNVDECADNPCQNGATCIDGVDSYTCDCADGFWGFNCDTACVQGNCVGTVSCDQDDGENRTCSACLAGYSGVDCSTNIDDCTPNPCQSGATCIDGVDGYTCVCPAGFWGQNCELSCTQGNCVGTVTCDSDDGENRMCSACLNGFEGTDCSINTDDCDPNPCQNGGTCIDGVAEYTCNCAGDFVGPNCQTNLLSGAVLWVDMQDTSAYVQSAGDMVSITNKVSDVVWDDAASTNKPTFEAAGLNGLPAMGFELLEERALMSTEAAVVNALEGNVNYTLFMVLQSGQTMASLSAFGVADSSGGSAARFIGQASTDGGLWRNSFVNDDGTFTVNQTEQNNDTSPHVNMWRVSMGNITFQLDGAALTVEPGTQTPGTMTLDTACIGCVPRMTPINWYKGTGGEWILYNSALSAQAVSDVTSYLIEKWGL